MMCRSRNHSTSGRRLVAMLFVVCICSSGNASRLDTMFARGDSAILMEWTPDSGNTKNDWYVKYGSSCSGADSVYRHCDFIAGQTYRSVAYSYGGEDGAATFRDKINRGLLIGSHQCHYKVFGDPSKVIAGTDCSGFVCHLWDVPRVTTNELYSDYTTITRAQLDVGDILVKPGSHAVLVIEREDASHLLIWESTSAVNGCRERTITITDTYWDAYYPRRFTGLNSSVRQTALHTESNPFPRINWAHGKLTIADGTWRGTITVYSLLGKRLASKICSAGLNAPSAITTAPMSGIVIVDMQNADGERLRQRSNITRN